MFSETIVKFGLMGMGLNVTPLAGGPQGVGDNRVQAGSPLVSRLQPNTSALPGDARQDYAGDIFTGRVRVHQFGKTTRV